MLSAARFYAKAWPLHWYRLPALARALVILSDGASLHDLARQLKMLVCDLTLPLLALVESGLIEMVPACEAPALPLLPIYAAMRPLPFWLDFLLFGGTDYYGRYAAYFRFYDHTRRGRSRYGRSARQRSLFAAPGVQAAA